MSFCAIICLYDAKCHNNEHYSRHSTTLNQNKWNVFAQTFNITPILSYQVQNEDQRQSVAKAKTFAFRHFAFSRSTSCYTDFKGHNGPNYCMVFAWYGPPG